MEIDKALIDAAAAWGLRVRKIRREIEIAGSPERCELRFVIECDDDRLYVLESIFDEDVDRKLKIIYFLEFLSRKGASRINPYMAAQGSEYIVPRGERFWQISPFIRGVPLDRPAYVLDRWRGKVLADFLVELREKSRGAPYFSGRRVFSITDFIHRLLGEIKENEPGLRAEIQPAVDFLENGFMDVHDQLPTAFCHGDYHPLNIIWAEKAIEAVIDWEFLGYKPDIYDAANMIGCIGVENPEGLSGDLVKDFIGELKKSGIISPLSWEHLHDFVVAMRFAWLSEWLRNRDKEMIELEKVYMKLLLDNRETLKRAWES